METVGPAVVIASQIPRLAMTNEQLDQVADAIISLYEQRDKIPPLEAVREGEWRDQMRYRWVYTDLDAFEFDECQVAVQVEVVIAVPDVGDAAAHAGGKVAACGPEDYHAAAGHVFAAVVAHPFHHRVHAAVANTEALAGNSPDIGFTGSGNGVPVAEVLLRIGTGAETLYTCDAVDLEILWPRSVRHHVILMMSIVEMDTIRASRKEIDCWRAVQLKVALAD